jgi:hypothetical protein
MILEVVIRKSQHTHKYNRIQFTSSSLGFSSDNGNGIKVITVKTDFKIITPRLLALLRSILHDLGLALLAATINAGEQTLVVKPLGVEMLSQFTMPTLSLPNSITVLIQLIATLPLA